MGYLSWRWVLFPFLVCGDCADHLLVSTGGRPRVRFLAWPPDAEEVIECGKRELDNLYGVTLTFQQPADASAFREFLPSAPDATVCLPSPCLFKGEDVGVVAYLLCISATHREACRGLVKGQVAGFAAVAVTGLLLKYVTKLRKPYHLL